MLLERFDHWRLVAQKLHRLEIDQPSYGERMLTTNEQHIAVQDYHDYLYTEKVSDAYRW